MQITKEQAKLTAHGMWSNLLSDELHAIFYPLRPQKKAELESIHDKVISTVLKHETTRLRVHVDKLITQLQITDEKLKHFQGELSKVKIWQPKKRNRIRSEILVLHTSRAVYMNAVSILTNTPPEIEGPPGGQVFETPKGNIKVSSIAASMSKVELKVNR